MPFKNSKIPITVVSAISPETVEALQTNDEPVGFFYKQISRTVQPVAALEADLLAAPSIELPAATTVEIQPDKIFTLFACCIPVKGATRSIICDIQRQHFDFIPNALYQLLTDHKQQSYGAIVAHYGDENEAVIAEYFQFLAASEYGFGPMPMNCRSFLP